MSIYLTRAHYSQESFKGMTAKPEDREVAAKAMFGAAGMKLHNLWYAANGEVICILEGTAVAGGQPGLGHECLVLAPALRDVDGDTHQPIDLAARRAARSPARRDRALAALARQDDSVLGCGRGPRSRSLPAYSMASRTRPQSSGWSGGLRSAPG